MKQREQKNYTASLKDSHDTPGLDYWTDIWHENLMHALQFSGKLASQRKQRAIYDFHYGRNAGGLGHDVFVTVVT